MFTSCDVAVRSSLMVLAIWSVVVSVSAEGCLHCKQKPKSSSSRDHTSASEKDVLNQEKASKEELLDQIETAIAHCQEPFHVIDVDIPTEAYDSVVEKMDLVIRVLGGYFPHHEQKMLRTFIEETVLSDAYTPSGRLLWIGNGSLLQPDYYVSVEDESNEETERRFKNIELEDYGVDGSVPWLMVSGLELDSVKEDPHPAVPDLRSPVESQEPKGNWTEPYFDCKRRKWIISYTSLIFSRSRHMRQKRQDEGRIVGIMSIDVDGTDIDINQCDTLSAFDNVTDLQMKAFLGTHKCDNHTSQCIFTPGYGWARGSYKCQCRDGFYSATGNPLFNGSLVESAFKDKITLNRCEAKVANASLQPGYSGVCRLLYAGNIPFCCLRVKVSYTVCYLKGMSPTYDMLYICKPCQPGCDTCIDDSPCLSNYNWAFRISLLTISVICILLTIVLSVYVYRYRKVKVIKVASPIFLCITLLGCVIMYCEMAAIFPVLDMYSCVATKWTRHMGFCITYSALLLKTWRVSLTYRVKSAHKLKLTDKQLLQWLFPILLVMAVYLGTWTISSPPVAVYIQDWYKLKFKQCDYNWWDHSLAIGEFLFLLWGIRVCYNVRNAESFFNEAKHISWAVHSITIVNIIMVMIHLVILPSAGPDIKYLFGFFRTQLSTTITVILIFGPKFYRVIKGQGDTWDNRARARGVTASFSLNGVGPVYEEPQDLYQENEELKEEVQKLASQIEFMRIVHMEINNRHLKPKHGGFFSQPTVNQSPVMKNIYMKFDSTDSPGSRISPAAELVSEKV